MRKQVDPGRIKGFSDGVLAIVITLLVLEIKVPHLMDAFSRHEALEALRLLLPKFGSFVLSFAYIAVFWVNHHHFFDLIENARSSGLIWLNNLLLLFLCFVPFPTAFIGEYPHNPVGLALFAAVLMSAGITFTVMWYYAYNRGLMDSSVKEKTVKEAVISGMFGPPLYAFAAIMGFKMPWVAWAIFSAVPLYFLFHAIRASHQEEFEK